MYKSNYSWSSYFSDVDEFNVIISVDDINYVIMSETQKTVHVANGEYDKVLNVPATIKVNNFEWKVIGIEEDARNRNGLSAIIWNSDYPFTGSVSNPNLLLYVNSKNSASNEIKNVIINNKADNIELTDAAGGNNFYCPRAFTAAQVTYGHNYKMKTNL